MQADPGVPVTDIAHFIEAARKLDELSIPPKGRVVFMSPTTWLVILSTGSKRQRRRVGRAIRRNQITRETLRNERQILFKKPIPYGSA